MKACGGLSGGGAKRGNCLLMISMGLCISGICIRLFFGGGPRVPPRVWSCTVGWVGYWKRRGLIVGSLGVISMYSSINLYGTGNKISHFRKFLWGGCWSA